MRKQIEQVGEFQAKFGLSAVEQRVPSEMANEDLQAFRLRRLLSEVEEICEASGYVIYVNDDDKLDVERIKGKPVDLEEVLDGYVDLLYIMLGSIRFHGFHLGGVKFTPYEEVSRFEHAFNRVHYKNMLKEAVQREDESEFGSMYDIVKPEGWEAANLKDLIEP